MRILWFYCCLVFYGILNYTAQAQELDTSHAKARKDWAVASVNLGLGLTRAAVAGSNVDFPPSDQPVSAQKQALMDTLSDYQHASAEAQGHVTALRAVADFAVNGTAIVLTTTGVGAVPAAIVKATGQLANDMVLSSFEKDIQASVNAMLVKKKEQLLHVGGVRYDDLRKKSPAEIKKALEQGTNVFADMEQLMHRKPEAVQMASPDISPNLGYRGGRDVRWGA